MWIRSAHELLRVIVRDYLANYYVRVEKSVVPMIVYSSNVRHAVIVHGVLADVAEGAFGKDAAKRVVLLTCSTQLSVQAMFFALNPAGPACDVMVVAGIFHFSHALDAYFTTSFDFLFQSVQSQQEEQQFVQRLRQLLRHDLRARRYGWIEQSWRESTSGASGRVSSVTFARRWLGGLGVAATSDMSVRTTQTLCSLAKERHAEIGSSEIHYLMRELICDFSAEDNLPVNAERWRAQWSSAAIAATARKLQTSQDDDLFLVHVCGESDSASAYAPDAEINLAADLHRHAPNGISNFPSIPDTPFAPTTGPYISQERVESVTATVAAFADAEFGTTPRLEEIVRWRAASLGGMHIPTERVLAALLRERADENDMRKYFYLRDLLFYMAHVHRNTGGWPRIHERRQQTAPAGAYLNALPITVWRLLEDCVVFNEFREHPPVFTGAHWRSTRALDGTLREIMRSEQMCGALTLVLPTKQIVDADGFSEWMRDLLLQFALYTRISDGMQWDVVEVTKSVAIVKMLVNEDEFQAIEELFDGDMQLLIRQNVEGALSEVVQQLRGDMWLGE